MQLPKIVNVMQERERAVQEHELQERVQVSTVQERGRTQLLIKWY